MPSAFIVVLQVLKLSSPSLGCAYVPTVFGYHVEGDGFEGKKAGFVLSHALAKL
jgi:hypothetical protein